MLFVPYTILLFFQYVLYVLTSVCIFFLFFGYSYIYIYIYSSFNVLFFRHTVVPISSCNKYRNPQQLTTRDIEWFIIASYSREYIYSIYIYNIVFPYLAALSRASLLTGGTMKHTEGTTASLPERLRTFHLKGAELLRRAHSSPLWTVICKNQVTEGT